MRKLLSVPLLLCHFLCFGQLTDNFADGNFSANPAWIGDPTHFLVNSAGQLQSNGPAVTGTVLQLVTPASAVTGTTWEFYARLNLATSAANLADVFLMSDLSDLDGPNQGYFVRIGGTPDEVSLFRKDAAGSPGYVINGRDGTMAANTGNVVRVRVTRDVQSQWTLWIDATGSGQSFVLEGTARDDRYQVSAFFGILLRYSSANSQRFLFDDFRITDQQPPQLAALTPVNSRSLDVLLNEVPARPISPNQFLVSGGVGSPLSVTPDPADARLLRLVFSRDFAAGESTLTCTGLADQFGNKAGSMAAVFTYLPPVVAAYREVRINEVLIDDDPPVGLPEAEFIELFNASTKTFNLQNWKYSDATAAAGTLPECHLAPGAFVLLCRTADTALFRPYGRVLGLNTFPALNDGGDAVELFDQTGKLIDRIVYSSAWYQDPLKTSGGWTLELINPTTPCGNGENYRASTDPAGGTPGRRNAVWDISPDTQPPALLRCDLLADNQVRLSFSETLDSLQALNLNNYLFSGGISVVQGIIQGPALREVTLTLNQALQIRQVYSLGIQNLADCLGNRLNLALAATLVLPEKAAAGDLVINEVLFNPRSGGVDFVELVNRSPKYLDLKDWQLGNQRPDSLADHKVISLQSYRMAPQQYVVLSTKPEVLVKHYGPRGQDTFLPMKALPSYPDEAGTVRILSPEGVVVDQMHYDQKMHFPLLDDVNGVSLERIRLDGDSSRANWHSAAAAVSFATPGYRNSQAYAPPALAQVFTIEPKVFSPDGDGEKDFATINYQNEVAGFVASITIYDAAGRQVRRLVKNELLARDGFFRWDGLDEKGRKAAVGYYVLLVELFKLSGETRNFKETVVLGAKF